MWFFFFAARGSHPKKNRPALGTTMYFVNEHFYYIPEKRAPVKEYCVCDGVVKSFIEGKYVEVVIVGKDPDGYLTPYYYKISDIGKKVFCSRQEAEQLAETKSDYYERAWGWLGEPDIPLRRSWRVKEEYDAVC